MNAFTFQRVAAAADAASAVAARPGAMFLAGGTTLVDLMKIDVLTPDTVVSVRRSRDVGHRRIDDAIAIGATVTNSQLAWHPVVRDRYPVLVGSDPVGRYHADPQHGDRCGQHPAADALPLFPRCPRVMQPQTAWLRMRRARRLQPRTRGTGRQRPLHCHASIRHVRGAGQFSMLSFTRCGPMAQRVRFRLASFIVPRGTLHTSKLLSSTAS